MTESFAQSPGQDANRKAADAVGRGLRQIWLATLGVAPTVFAGAGHLFETLVENGTRFESEHTDAFSGVSEKFARGVDAATTRVSSGFSRVGKSVREFAGKDDATLDRKIESAIEHAGLATKQEIVDLADRLDRMSALLDEVASRN